jgi:hypothetical protein
MILIHPKWAERSLNSCLAFARQQRCVLLIARGRHLKLRPVAQLAQVAA